ncbi:hypothetical protein TNCV_2836311 [Trichonephila clavipes]|nr:hypothetical protein TNCV_2836311 [Trichonephila clavipes]
MRRTFATFVVLSTSSAISSILLERKSQSRHYLAFEILSLLHFMSSRFRHLLHRILEILGYIGHKVHNLLHVVVPDHLITKSHN